MQLLDDWLLSVARCTSSVIAVEHLRCRLAQTLAHMACPSSVKYACASFIMSAMLLLADPTSGFCLLPT